MSQTSVSSEEDSVDTEIKHGQVKLDRKTLQTALVIGMWARNSTSQPHDVGTEESKMALGDQCFPRWMPGGTQGCCMQFVRVQ